MRFGISSLFLQIEGGRVIMSKNPGKKFEEDIKSSANIQNIFILRLNDSSLSWQHEKTSRFTAENPYDFIMFCEPNLFCLELKSTCYSSISIQRLPEEKNKMIKLHQINSLTQSSLHEGVYAGFIFNFRDDEDINNNDTYYMPIGCFNDFLVERDKRSINKLDIVQYGGIKLSQKIKRTRYTYDINKMIQDVINTKD